MRELKSALVPGTALATRGPSSELASRVTTLDRLPSNLHARKILNLRPLHQADKLDSRTIITPTRTGATRDSLHSVPVSGIENRQKGQGFWSELLSIAGGILSDAATSPLRSTGSQQTEGGLIDPPRVIVSKKTPSSTTHVEAPQAALLFSKKVLSGEEIASGSPAVGERRATKPVKMTSPPCLVFTPPRKELAGPKPPTSWVLSNLISDHREKVRIPVNKQP